MTNEKPKIFYKYHKINDNLYTLLKASKLWFSHQNDLNDPYDCKYSLSKDYLVTLLKNSSNAILKDLQDRSPKLKQLNQDKFLELILPTILNEEWINGFYNMLFNDLGFNVCCFTTDALNEIMWAHYADNNKGVCLQFDLSTSPELYEKTFRVNYDDTFPVINSMNDLQNALLTKRKAWHVENEWRILTNVNGGKQFNKQSLTSIYFGCYVKPDVINNIRQIMIASGYTKVNFRQVNFYIDGIQFKPLDK